jgi:Pentapeptide repeats (9 copies)
VRVIADHLRDHEYRWSGCNFDFRTAHLENVDLREAFFSGLTRFDRAEFSGAALFQGARFVGATVFNGGSFTADAWFDGTEFSGLAWFSKGVGTRLLLVMLPSHPGEQRIPAASSSPAIAAHLLSRWWPPGGQRADGLDPDDPAVIAAIDLVRWELLLGT